MFYYKAIWQNIGTAKLCLMKLSKSRFKKLLLKDFDSYIGSQAIRTRPPPNVLFF